MLRRAMTRRIRTGSANDASVSDPGNDRLGRELESGRELDARLVAERLPRSGDVRPGVADVSGAGRLEAPLDRLAQDRAGRLGHVVDAGRRAGRHVEGAPA